MITFENVSVSFDKREILQNLNLSLSERRIAVIGANGSGKSTFVRLLNGLILPTKGRVIVDGLDSRREGKALRRKVGFVFQNPDNQIVMPTVEEDLAFGMKNLGLNIVEIEQRIETTLQHYNLLDLRKQAAHFLSGGQKQLLAICSVLVMKPNTIILDEPTTQLDLRNKRKIIEVINQLPQRIIMTSHDLPLLKNFERVLVFNDGQVVCDSLPTKAINFYENLFA
ncbi:MAG: biotin transport system ATP-binding protein [Candidatus Tokpelaia sp. JSC188]|nr:MAG: biotin transport system ATP-binding protein [Candidatus Tokpelaia sp. JSC188]